MACEICGSNKPGKVVETYFPGDDRYVDRQMCSACASDWSWPWDAIQWYRQEFQRRLVNPKLHSLFDIRERAGQLRLALYGTGKVL